MLTLVVAITICLCSCSLLPVSFVCVFFSTSWPYSVPLLYLLPVDYLDAPKRLLLLFFMSVFVNWSVSKTEVEAASLLLQHQYFNQWSLFYILCQIKLHLQTISGSTEKYKNHPNASSLHPISLRKTVSAELVSQGWRLNLLQQLPRSGGQARLPGANFLSTSKKLGISKAKMKQQSVYTSTPTLK